jgi:hypothetical protein
MTAIKVAFTGYHPVNEMGRLKINQSSILLNEVIQNTLNKKGKQASLSYRIAREQFIGIPKSHAG